MNNLKPIDEMNKRLAKIYHKMFHLRRFCYNQLANSKDLEICVRASTIKVLLNATMPNFEAIKTPKEIKSQ